MMPQHDTSIADPGGRHLTLVASQHVVNPRHPSLFRTIPRTAMYDQDTPVTLTRLEAELIASLLKATRGHFPSPKAADSAIEILMGRRA